MWTADWVAKGTADWGVMCTADWVAKKTADWGVMWTADWVAKGTFDWGVMWTADWGAFGTAVSGAIAWQRLLQHELHRHYCGAASLPQFYRTMCVKFAEIT